MKTYFFSILILFFVFSCKKEVSKITTSSYGTHKINYLENGSELILKSGKFTYNISNSKLPFNKVILLNASLVGYFTELRVEDKIIGVSSPEYIFSDKINQLIKSKKIENIGNEQKYDVEKILSLKPDAIFTNYIASFENTYDLLKKNGIEVIFIDDFAEETPLNKAKIIEIFGRLLGEKEKSSEIYKEIEKNYNSYKELAIKQTKPPAVLANEMYGNQWFLPGGKTFVAKYISDASGNYILKDNIDSKAVPMSFEEVFVKSEHAEFWVNVGNHQSKKELLQINPNYAKMNVYKSGKIYGVNGKETGKANDFFESGIVRADLVLKDYIKIFHPKIFPEYQLTYMKELE